MYLLPNHSIAYHLLLDDRRFEEFVRDLYFQDIQAKVFDDQFDNVQLLSGNKEQGRDCVLYKNGNSAGVIQCKRYDRALTKPESAKEIIKFCLYSVKYADFIFDINTFEYHFVASSGFNNQAMPLLNNFPEKITQETELSSWIDKVIHEYKTLDEIDPYTIKQKLYDILFNIKIIPIDGTELDRKLSCEHNKNLCSKYFEVKKVIDPSEVLPKLEAISKKIEEQTKSYSIYNPELLDELGCASFTLYGCKNYFGNLADSNIKRKETTELFNWIKSSLPANSEEKSENIIFLSGCAGCGKTTILRDLYELLDKEKIPVLGLKSDALVANNLDDLRLKINLTYPIEKSIIEVSKNVGKAVVLIDQLDALSQYLSSSRDYVNTYIRLIESFKNFHNIRVIVSIREYDLNYDFSFHAYKKSNKILVSELRDEDVEHVLFKLKLEKRQLTDTLFSLLRNPNNLDVFCRIYNNETKFHEIKSLQDLYTELWKQLKRHPNVDKNNQKKLIYEIVEKQYEQQTITVSSANLAEDYLNEFNSLRSKGIIIEEKDNLIRFFHQSFYDYLFAKRFIEEKRDVVEYIKANNQSLESRSGLKMIISYLSTSDRNEYIRITKYIIQSGKIRFHIKSLIISLLSNVEDPLDDEKQLVLKLIYKKKKYYDVFIDSLISKGWTNWLIQEGLLNGLYELKPTKMDELFNAKTRFAKWVLRWPFYNYYLPFEARKNQSLSMATFLLRRNLQSNIDDILALLLSLKFEEKKQVVGRILYFNQDWTNPLAYELFLYCKNSLDLFSYYHILENIVPINVDFVIKEIEKNISDEIFEREKREQRDAWHHEKELLDLISKVSSEKAITFLFNTVLSAIKSHEHLWSCEEDRLLVPDGLFTSFSIINNKSDYHTNKERIYARLIYWVKEIRIKNPAFYDNFVRTHYTSKYHSILKIVLCVLDSPDSNKEDLVISIIKRMHQINQITDHGELQGDLFRLIQLWLPIFCNKNKRAVLDIILSLRDQGKLTRDYRVGRNSFYSSYGHATYLFIQAFPIDYINSIPEARKIYQELNRKFPEEKPSDYLYSTRFQSGGIASPIKHDAYTKMTDAQWLKSFLKYKKDEFSYDFKGGREQHARKFQEEVKKQPDRFVNLVHQMIIDEKIHHSYIVQALYAFGESDLPNQTLRDIFVAAIKNKRYSNDKLFYITQSLQKLFVKGIEDQTIIDFAINLALSYPSPERLNESDLYSSAMTSVRGSTIDALYCLNMEKYGDVVLRTMEKVAQDANDSILISVLYGIAYLNKQNIKDAFSLFISITANASDQVFVHSINAAQYYTNYDFSRLRYYFLRAKEIKDEQFRRNISAILYFAWINDYSNAEFILFDYIDNDPICIAEVISYSINNFYCSKDPKGKKAIFILNKYVNYKNESISHQYDCCFIHYEKSNIKFIDLYPFVIKYITSKSFDLKRYYIFDYLLKYSNEYSDKCFEVFKKINFYQIRKEKETEYSFIVRERQMRLLMGFYNIFKQDKKRYRSKLAYINKIFDVLFEDIGYKDHIDKALYLISK